MIVNPHNELDQNVPRHGQDHCLHLEETKSVEGLSELNQSRGIIVENPDGSLLEGKRAPANKPEERKSEEVVNPEQAEDNEQLLQLLNDEEVALLANGMQQFPDFVDDVIGLYIKHERIFTVVILLQVLIEGLFNVLAVVYAKQTIIEMRLIYGGIGPKQAAIVFWVLYCCNPQTHLKVTMNRRYHLLLYLLSARDSISLPPLGETLQLFHNPFTNWSLLSNGTGLHQQIQPFGLLLAHRVLHLCSVSVLVDSESAIVTQTIVSCMFKQYLLGLYS
jgi:hypothetical protein